MSTTTDTGEKIPAVANPVKAATALASRSLTAPPGKAPRSRLVPGALLALAIWLSGVALATLWFEPTRDVVVIAATRQASLSALGGSGAGIVDMAQIGVLARGEAPGFVARLYAAGAWLVLPARSGGCAGRLFARGGADGQGAVPAGAWAAGVPEMKKP